jgi:hypothetical protein
MMTTTTSCSLIGLFSFAQSVGLNITLDPMMGESLITRARNLQAAKFLSFKFPDGNQATHLLMIDSDIGFTKDDVVTLLRHNLPIVAGVYPIKTIPSTPCIKPLGDLPPLSKDTDNLQEVACAGTGFLMVKREVLEDMRDNGNLPSYRSNTCIDIENLDEVNSNLRDYFTLDIRDEEYLSEDWTFCLKAREMGYPVMADKSIRLNHQGQFTFGLNSDYHLYKQFHKKTTVNDIFEKELQNENI